MTTSIASPALRSISLDRVGYDDTPADRVDRSVPVEAPIAIEYNGIGYSVMMGTPTDLADFVTGFTLSEGLAHADELSEPQIVPVEGGWVARLNLPPRSLPRILERARSRVSGKRGAASAVSTALQLPLHRCQWSSRGSRLHAKR
jgi:FdhD protein